MPSRARSPFVPRFSRQLPALALLLVVGFSARSEAQADDPVVVEIGPIQIRASDVERRLKRVPEFQLSQYGATPEAIKRAFVERELVPEALYSLGEHRQKLNAAPTVRVEIRSARLQALRATLERELAAKGPVDDAAISAYYQQNITRFKTPERIKIWRILVADRAQAEALLKQLKGAKDVKAWSELAKQHSLDEDTKSRDGDLGFVLPDGKTYRAKIQVSPSIFSAANQVKNGELVPEPIAEGERWAIVWRRGSLKAVERSLDAERENIRRLLERERTSNQVEGLVKELTAKHVKDRRDDILEQADFSHLGQIGANRAPGKDPHAPSAPPPSSIPEQENH